MCVKHPSKDSVVVFCPTWWAEVDSEISLPGSSPSPHHHTSPLSQAVDNLTSQPPSPDVSDGDSNPEPQCSQV